MSVRIGGLDLVVANLREWDERKRAGLEHLARTQIAPLLERDAKENRPWTDRTGNARRGLTGSVEMSATDLAVRLAHTVSYGVYLEYMQAGRFSILMPTMLKNKSQIEHMIRSYWEGG